MRSQRMQEMPDNRPSWDQTWLAIAREIGRRSRCSRAGIGSVVVSRDNRICATGYNGPAASWPEHNDCSNWCPRAMGHAPLDNMYDACPAVHAEANALLYVDRSRVEGGTIYITSASCMQCAKLISNSGIARVVMVVRQADLHRKPSDVISYLEKCKIEVSAWLEQDIEQ